MKSNMELRNFLKESENCYQMNRMILEQIINEKAQNMKPSSLKGFIINKGLSTRLEKKSKKSDLSVMQALMDKLIKVIERQLEELEVRSDFEDKIDDLLDSKMKKDMNLYKSKQLNLELTREQKSLFRNQFQILEIPKNHYKRLYPEYEDLMNSLYESFSQHLHVIKIKKQLTTTYNSLIDEIYFAKAMLANPLNRNSISSQAFTDYRSVEAFDKIEQDFSTPFAQKSIIQKSLGELDRDYQAKLNSLLDMINSNEELIERNQDLLQEYQAYSARGNRNSGNVDANENCTKLLDKNANGNLIF